MTKNVIINTQYCWWRISLHRKLEEKIKKRLHRISSRNFLCTIQKITKKMINYYSLIHTEMSLNWISIGHKFKWSTQQIFGFFRDFDHLVTSQKLTGSSSLSSDYLLINCSSVAQRNVDNYLKNELARASQSANVGVDIMSYFCTGSSLQYRMDLWD